MHDPIRPRHLDDVRNTRRIGKVKRNNIDPAINGAARPALLRKRARPGARPRVYVVRVNGGNDPLDVQIGTQQRVE